jgi:hypothetical protein
MTETLEILFAQVAKIGALSLYQYERTGEWSATISKTIRNSKMEARSGMSHLTPADALADAIKTAQELMP